MCVCFFLLSLSLLLLFPVLCSMFWNVVIVTFLVLVGRMWLFLFRCYSFSLFILLLLSCCFAVSFACLTLFGCFFAFVLFFFLCYSRFAHAHHALTCFFQIAACSECFFFKLFAISWIFVLLLQFAFAFSRSWRIIFLNGFGSTPYDCWIRNGSLAGKKHWFWCSQHGSGE